MGFQVGDKVIHYTFGLGEISKIEEKTINGHPTTCFVFHTNDLTIWVPMDDGENNSLRTPTPPEEFTRILDILTSPSETLVEDRVLRKTMLVSQLNDGKLASICQVVRDLTHYQRSSKLNDQEKSILERAVKSLLTEWAFSLGTPNHQAHQTMDHMLEGI